MNLKMLLAGVALFAGSLSSRALAQCSSWSNVAQISGYHTNGSGVVIDQELASGEEFILFFNFGTDTMGVWVDDLGNDYISGYSQDGNGVGTITFNGYTMTISCDKDGTGIVVNISGNGITPSRFAVDAGGSVQALSIPWVGTSARKVFGDWTMIPILNSTADRVEAVFAWADPLVLEDDNLPFVAYLRDPVTDDYSVWGWPAGTDRADALAWLVDTYGPTAFAPEEELVAEASVSPALPVSLTYGMPTSDPIQELLEIAEEPAELVGMAVTAGLEAAPTLSLLSAAAPGGPVYTVAPCNGTAVLTEKLLFLDSVHNFEMALMGSSTVVAADPCAQLCAGCSYTTGDWSAWTVTSVPDGQTAFQLCTYTRTRQLWVQGYEIWSCDRCTIPASSESEVVGPKRKANCGSAP